jgi:transposase
MYVTRIQKAKMILSKNNTIRKINRNIYLVQSQTGIGWYKLQWNGKIWTCNCPDFIKNGHIRPCKHIHALDIRLESLINPYINEDGPVLEKPTYNQNWPLYNMAQTQEFELFDQFLYQLVSYIEEPKQNDLGRPRIKLKDQVFCCIMKVYSQLSSRRAQYLYYDALERQQIQHAPHFNIVSKSLNKKELKPVLHELVHLSSQPLGSIETDFAIDSSGFRCSTFGGYNEEKHGEKRSRNWLKAHICTGVNTNIVTDIVITSEHGGDSPQLKKLIQNTADHFIIGEVSADMAYCSRKNYDIIDQYGGTAYIPFRKGMTGRSKGTPLWNRAYHYFKLNADDFMEHYHKRSNAESTFAAIKKKFGETIKSKNRIAQENELLCKIIAYNISVLIHSMYELGITPNFCA